MKSMFRTVLVTMLAMLALSAVTAGAAQALEAPHWNVAGSRLAAGESDEVTPGAMKVEIAIGGYLTKCSLTFSSGVKILGSSIGNSGTSELTMELSGCTELGRGCKFASEPLKSVPLVGMLVWREENREGPLAFLLKPKSGSAFLKAKITGSECPLPEGFEAVGSLAAEVFSGGKPVEIGKEPAEAKTVELELPSTRIAHVEKIEGGASSRQKVTWEWMGAGLAIETNPGSPLALTSTLNWGVFQTLA